MWKKKLYFVSTRLKVQNRAPSDSGNHYVVQTRQDDRLEAFTNSIAYIRDAQPMAHVAYKVGPRMLLMK